MNQIRTEQQAIRRFYRSWLSMIAYSALIVFAAATVTQAQDLFGGSDANGFGNPVPANEGENRVTFRPDLVVEVNLAAIQRHNNGELRELFAENFAADLQEAVGLKLADIQSIEFHGDIYGMLDRSYYAPKSAWLVVLRANKNHQVLKESTKSEIRRVLKSIESYDDRTLLVSGQEAIRKWGREKLSKGEPLSPLITEAMRPQGVTQLVGVGLDWQAFTRQLSGTGELPREISMTVGPLLTPIRRWNASIVSIAGQSDLQVNLNGLCTSAENAKGAAETLQAVRVLAKNAMGSMVREFVNNSADLDDALLIGDGLRTVDQLLKSIEIVPSGNMVTARGSIGDDAIGVLQFAIDAIDKSRQQQSRLVRSNNLKQIMLALHNYADAYRKFPPRVIRDANGVERSWRVELLPFLERADLYQRYRKDEPWDSEANLAVLKEMPPVFSSDHEEGNYTTSYFVVDGENCFLSERGNRFAMITDGTSNTLSIVEANRAIPWTKPEDIPLEEASFMELVGPDADYLQFAFVDASVTSVAKKSLDAATWRKLLICNDGEPFDRESLFDDRR